MVAGENPFLLTPETVEYDRHPTYMIPLFRACSSSPKSIVRGLSAPCRADMVIIGDNVEGIFPRTVSNVFIQVTHCLQILQIDMSVRAAFLILERATRTARLPSAVKYLVDRASDECPYGGHLD